MLAADALADRQPVRALLCFGSQALAATVVLPFAAPLLSGTLFEARAILGTVVTNRRHGGVSTERQRGRGKKEAANLHAHTFG
jgi:hypothetical protein